MGHCENWAAWLNERSREGGRLHVTGDCVFPTTGYAVDLRRLSSVPTGSHQTSIQGPALWPRLADPPVFHIAPGNFYSVEAATRADLLHRGLYGHLRTDDNFYASWRVLPHRSGRSFTLPADVWERLRGADQLFYRLWQSDEANRWSNPSATTADRDCRQAPFIQIVDGDTITPADPGYLRQSPEKQKSDAAL
ncbi:MAG: hypothetical protein V4671_16670 [Armatimonadota bacterium]